MAKTIYVMGQEITIEEEGLPSGILVYVETADGKPGESSLRALKMARVVADKIGARLSALVIGKDLKGVTEMLSGLGADNVIIKDEAGALQDVIAAENPEILVFGQSRNTVDLAAGTAQALKTGLVCNCIGLDVDPERRLLVMKRAIYNGLVIEELICPKARPQMATVA